MCSGIRQKLIEKGTNIIATLPKVFKSMPSYDGIDKISVNEFFSTLLQFGYNIRKEDAVLLVRYFDKDNSEMMNFDDFLMAIRGKPNDERQAVIDLVFYKFDKNKTGTAEATELRKVFNCANHPKLLMREFTEDQIFYLFLQNFSSNVNGTVSKKVIDIHYLYLI